MYLAMALDVQSLTSNRYYVLSDGIRCTVSTRTYFCIIELNRNGHVMCLIIALLPRCFPYCGAKRMQWATKRSYNANESFLVATQFTLVVVLYVASSVCNYEF
jgi:hypothetical protein